MEILNDRQIASKIAAFGYFGCGKCSSSVNPYLFRYKTSSSPNLIFLIVHKIN
jgi:hypothetical protein